VTILDQLQAALSDRYSLEREIGHGGMATVYLARDVKHDRHVALKVLDPELGAVLGAERFLAEIKVTANLQHPNLLPLFDSGEAGGLLFYVMPFVEGESLRARLEREKQLPVDEAIRISVAIANALEYAHGHGVIHRDLKPENILVQHGQPVIADFGIALAVSKAGGARITQTGLSLGTPQYMSPEQATGDRVIDGRSDIYSLAAMTYEMLAGEPPHTGTTAQAIIARVLTDRPRSLRSTRPAVPEHVEATLERALEKLPADRFGTAREFAEALQGRAAFVAHGTSSRAAATAAPWRARLLDPVVLVSVAVAVAATTAAVTFARRPTVDEPTHAIRFVVAPTDSVTPDLNLSPWSSAISHDGSMLVFQSQRAGRKMLYLLRTDQTEPHPIPGTENASQPLFSPDGQWLAFENNLGDSKVRLDGSAPVRIAPGNNSNNGADWTIRDELIIGSAGKTHGLSRVSAAGGDLVEFTHVDSAKGERDHVWPIATPDGKSAVFTVWRGALSSAELAMTPTDGGKISLLGIKAVRPLAILDGALVYLKADGAVMAVPLDLSGKRTAGSAVSVHDPVTVVAGNNGNSGIFISRGGALAVARGTSAGQLAWLARDGSVKPLSSDVRSFADPRLSPDGRRIAAAVTDAGAAKADVWIYDLASSTLSRLTSFESVQYFEWTRDGRSLVVLAAGAQDRAAFWLQPAEGGAAPTKLAEYNELSSTSALAPDRSALLVTAFMENNWAIVRIPLAPAGAPSVVLSDNGTIRGARFSPDGKLVAVVSDVSGRYQVYVRSYPDMTTRVQVSDAGGGSPVWSSDGKRLYYHAGSAIVQARLETTPALRVAGRDTVFRNVDELDAQDSPVANFDLAADGTRALVVRPSSSTSRLVVSPNWIVEFRRRMGEGKRK
jgi:serine/threonine-protein kinase